MNKDIAVVICNWNKKLDVLQCINKVLESKTQNFDIYVVDNASTDDSVEYIKREYGNVVYLIINSENKGGAGGFNAGIREALNQGYKYIHLLDNDAFVDTDTLEKSYEYMEQNEDVGAVGSKLFSYFNRDRLQEVGANINWDTFYVQPHYKGFLDSDEIPEIVECDYVPACSGMLRTEAVRKIGLIDEGCFIYWDDIEFFYRMKQAGYGVVAYSEAKAWHKMGVANRATTFGTYYFWRNRLNFFLKYLEVHRVPLFAKKIAEEMFQAMYMSNYTGQYSSARTIIMGVEDALAGIRGRAPKNRVVERESASASLDNLLAQQESILIVDDCDMQFLRVIMEKIQASTDQTAKVQIVAKQHSVQELQQQFPRLFVHEELTDTGAFVCVACNHVLDKRNEMDTLHTYLYIDQFFNTVYSEEEKLYIQNYDRMRELFMNIQLPVLQQRMLEWKERQSV